jgi:hypothetical protein
VVDATPTGSFDIGGAYIRASASTRRAEPTPTRAVGSVSPCRVASAQRCLFIECKIPAAHIDQVRRLRQQRAGRRLPAATGRETLLPPPLAGRPSLRAVNGNGHGVTVAMGLNLAVGRAQSADGNRLWTLLPQRR